jgi:hypothetical protein
VQTCLTLWLMILCSGLPPDIAWAVFAQGIVKFLYNLGKSQDRAISTFIRVGRLRPLFPATPVGYDILPPTAPAAPDFEQGA